MPNIPDAPLDQWTLVEGALMPLVVSVVNQSHWSVAQKRVASIVTCCVAAVIQCAVRGQLSLHNAGVAALGVTALAVATHDLFWRPTGIANAVEVATTPGATQ